MILQLYTYPGKSRESSIHVPLRGNGIGWMWWTMWNVGTGPEHSILQLQILKVQLKCIFWFCRLLFVLIGKQLIQITVCGFFQQDKQILPLFLFTCHIRFVLSQTWQTLSELKERNNNIYYTKFVSLNPPWSICW